MAFNTQFGTGMFGWNQTFGVTGGTASFKKQDDDTYNSRYPGFNKENYEKLEKKVSELGLTGSKKQEVMDQFYRQILPQVEEEKKKSKRNEVLNQKKFEISQIKDDVQRKVANHTYTVEELAQMVKEKENLREDAPDAEVFNTWISSIPNGEELLSNYMNKGDKELLYVGGLAEKPKETGLQKAEDFAVGVLQSPGKWGYNLVGRPLDWIMKQIGEGAADMLTDEQKENVVDWLDKNTIFKRDRINEYGQALAEKESEGNTFNGRENTDIRTPLLGEERANNGWTKAGEVVGDIGTAIALTAPMGAATAPIMADSTTLGAGILGGIEGGLDTVLTHYGSQGDLDITPMEGILGTLGGVLGGEMTRYLANLPKSQADNIRKQAEGYINKSIKPKTKANISKADIDKFTDDTLDVFKTLVTKDANGEYYLLQYTDDAGNIIKGKLPTNTQETMGALDNIKKVIFNQYDDIAKKAGQNGARVDLNKVFNNLDDLSKDTATGLGNSNAPAIVDDFKNRLLQFSDDAGTISIKDAQKVQQEYNLQLKSFFNNVSNSSDDVSKAGITSKVNKWVGDAIDDAIDKGYGNSASTEYRQLKHLYGQVKSVEKELAKRVSQQLKNTGSLPSDILDAVSGGEFTQAILTLDPVKFAKAGAIKGINQYLKRLKNPNTNISKLFKLVDNIKNPSTMQTVTSNVGNTIRQGLQKSAGTIPEVILPGSIATTESISNQ